MKNRALPYIHTPILSHLALNSWRSLLKVSRDMELQGKVALITGGATRLGRAITLALARSGCHVFIHYGRSTRSAQQTQAEARALGVEAHLHAGDLSDEKATHALVPAARKVFRKIDFLIRAPMPRLSAPSRGRVCRKGACRISLGGVPHFRRNS